MKVQTTELSFAQLQQVSGGVEPLSAPFEQAPMPRSPITALIQPIANRHFIGPKNPYGAPIEHYN